MQQIIKIWKNLLSLGLPQNASFKEQLRTELCNQFVFLGLFMTIFHLIFNLVFLRSIPDLIVGSIWGILLFSALILNILQKTKTSQIFLIVYGSASVFILHVLFGNEIKLESMYILFMVLAAAFLEYKNVIKSTLVILVLYILAIFICSTYTPPFKEYVSPTGPYSRFLFSCIMIISLISKLIIENLEYNKIMNIQNEDLVDSNEKLKSFNYIVSHDFKEPIRSIVSFSQLVEKQAKDNNKINYEHLKYIIRSGKQLNNLLDNLVLFRDSSEKLLTNDTFTIQEVITETELNLKELIDSRNAVITYNSTKPFQSSKMAFSIILKNLIENGIKYNKNKIPKIHVHASFNDNTLSLQVKDNGIGIEEEYLDDIFVLFKRLNSESEKGSGLGLNIVRNLIKRMYGSIHILSSSIKEGTTFSITIPLETSISK